MERVVQLGSVRINFPAIEKEYLSPFLATQTRKLDIIHNSGNDRKSNSLTLTEIIILCYYSVRVCFMERVVQL